ncbi:hypothetical protein WIW50_12340 [Flavobacteriaceae bacterium 3-367]|uniref:hypothetical protein n=1 Tax=Eudoraea algarum TaxID=3417568 RepID=UPI00327CFE82
MKHIFFVFFLSVMGLGMHAQQGFKVGIQGGLPFNDFNDEVGVVVGADVGYMWALGEVVDLGVSAGYIHGFAETFQTGTVLTGLSDVQFVPLAASLRIWPSDSFSFGIDGGQALGINDGNDGGLYYRPLIGFLLGAKTELNFSYTTIDLDDRSWTTVTLGILYTFTPKR